MKLKNLLKEVKEEASPELMALPFFREFQSAHGYKPLFKFLGTKNEEHIFTADMPDLGMLDLVIKDAMIMARITEKEAMFGVIYTCIDLDRCDIPVCKMKLKDNKVEVTIYDQKDKKNFSASATKFLDVIENYKEK